MEEFVIPVALRELTKRSSVNQFVVEEVFPVAALKREVRRCERAEAGDNFIYIIPSFGGFYSILVQWQEATPDVKEEAWAILLKGCQQAVKDLFDILETTIDKDSQTQFRNAVKMNVYLLCNFMDCFESDFNQTENSLTKKGRSRAKKGRTIITKMNIDWGEESLMGLETLEQLVKLPLQQLWDPPVVEEDLVSLIANVCYKALENADLASADAHRRAIGRILATLVSRFGHALSCCMKLTQLLSYFPDHMPDALLGLVKIFVDELDLRAFVKSILVEICAVSSQDLERDSSSAKAFAAFLTELSSRYPTLTQAVLPMLKSKLDDDPYTMRNCVLSVIGEIVMKIYANNEQLDSQHRNQRDKLFDLLLDHIHDINGFVRSRALNVWFNIVESGALPVRRQSQLVDLLVGEEGAIFDTACSARKFTLKILTSMVQRSPAAMLTHEDLKQSYEKEKEKLKEIESSSDPDNDWNVCLVRIQEALQQNALSGEMSTDIKTGESPESVASRISNALRSKEVSRIKQAVQLFSLAQDVFPDNPLFCDLNLPPRKSDDDSDEEQEEQQEEAMKRKLASWVSKMHDIFLSGGNSAASNEGEACGSQSDTRSTDYLRQRGLVEYLKETMKFAEDIQRAIPDVSTMLSSKTASDVHEAINFFVTGQLAGVPNMLNGVRKMLSLVWSKDASVKEAMVKAYRKLYLEQPSVETDNERTRAIAVVTGLSKLISAASLGDMLSLERLVGEFMKSGDLTKPILNVMWEKFTRKLPGSVEDAKAAIILIGFAAAHSPEIVRSNVDLIVQIGSNPEAGSEIPQLQFVECVCKALQRMAVPPRAPSAGAPPPKPYRFPASHSLFTWLADLLVKAVDSPDRFYIPMMEQAVSLTFALAEQPDRIMGGVIRRIAAVLVNDKENHLEGSDPAARVSDIMEVTEEGTAEAEKGAETEAEPGTQKDAEYATGEVSCLVRRLARFVSVCGHVALKQLVHLDVAILSELKRRAAIKEESEQHKNRKSKRSDRFSSKNQSRFSQSSTLKTDPSTITAEEEMGLAGATADDVEAEFVRRLCDTQLVTDPKGSHMLALVAPLIVHLCAKQHRYQSPTLQAAASLALTKFMLVSSDFCEANLQLLFTIAEKSPSEVIRANLVVALGDLTKRFPNLVEPWTPNLYARLRDPSGKVRVNAVNTLSHLILNDMVKVKGQISEMAACIVDSEERIQCLVKLFFNELAKKGNALYNIMPDIISRLSDAELPEEEFHQIMEFLFPNIQKDKQTESMVEKLCHRFRATQKSRHWRDLAFCLSLMTYNEKMLRKLQENFHCFVDKLHVVEVHAAFTLVLSNAKKSAKPEVLVIIEEMEGRIDEFHEKGVADEEALAKAEKAAMAARQKRKRSRRRTATAEADESTPGSSQAASQRATRGARSRRRQTDEMEEAGSTVTSSPPPRPSRGLRLRQRQVWSSEEEEED